MQVIGRVGFGKAFGALASLDHPAEGDAFKVVATGVAPPTQAAILPCVLQGRAYHVWNNDYSEGAAAGLEEVSKRLSNPLRKYMLWDQVSARALEPSSYLPCAAKV